MNSQQERINETIAKIESLVCKPCQYEFTTSDHCEETNDVVLRLSARFGMTAKSVASLASIEGCYHVAPSVGVFDYPGLEFSYLIKERE